jgi:hypothetical protein
VHDYRLVIISSGALSRKRRGGASIRCFFEVWEIRQLFVSWPSLLAFATILDGGYDGERAVEYLSDGNPFSV